MRGSFLPIARAMVLLVSLVRFRSYMIWGIELRAPARIALCTSRSIEDLEASASMQPFLHRPYRIGTRQLHGELSCDKIGVRQKALSSDAAHV